MRIAMWSGPRNISTAMLRSFGSRPDTAVTDEPLYAHYLKVTGVAHPGRDEVIAAHETDWRRVADELTGPIPGGRAIWYQKHMAHHLLPMIERGWLDRLTHAFLIREPDEMVASLLKTFPGAGLADTGLVQQCEIFDRVAERIGRAPPVVLASDVLKDPRAQLQALCEALGIPFLERDAVLARRPRATPTAPGRRTGTRRSRPRPDSNRIAAGTSSCRPRRPGSWTNAGPGMRSCTPCAFAPEDRRCSRNSTSATAT